MANIEQIETVLSRLQNNYSELERTFYTLFYDTTPQDVTLEWYDDKDVLQTVTIPNRAKDQKYIRNGAVDPEGVVSAPTGTLYQNTQTGALFIKNSGTGSSGWVKIISEADLDDFIIRGDGEPNENITAKFGTLYVNTANGVLYIKTLPTGSLGWQPIVDMVDSRFIHFIDLKKDVYIDVDIPSN